MTSISLHIEYLLTKHDCVILPGWGAFISQRSKAISEEDNSLIKRPSKHYIFNQSVNHNDGMLAHSIIRKDGISYDEANREIEDFVSSLKKQMSVDGTVAIGKVGCFHNVEENIVFEPYRRNNICDDNFGLADVTIKTLSQLLQANADSKSEYENRQSNVVIGFGKKFIQIAASIAVLICLTFVLSTPLSFESTTEYASINSALKIKTAENSIQLRQDGVLSIALPKIDDDAKIDDAESEHEATKAEIKAAATDEKLAMPHNEKGKYYLIVASLESKAQADKYLAKHSDDLRIIEGNGHYRIYAAQSNSYKTLKQISEQIADKYPNSWIFK